MPRIKLLHKIIIIFRVHACRNGIIIFISNLYNQNSCEILTQNGRIFFTVMLMF